MADMRQMNHEQDESQLMPNIGHRNKKNPKTTDSVHHFQEKYINNNQNQDEYQENYENALLDMDDMN